MSIIYVLELENGKIYVGRSSNVEERILNHFKNNGSGWTKIYKPIKVIEQFYGDAFDEEKYTLIYMDKYGIDNVRGGSYCKVILPQYEKEKALQIIRSVQDKCYKCGMSGHFVKECINNKKSIVIEPSPAWNWLKSKIYETYLFISEIPPASNK